MDRKYKGINCHLIVGKLPCENARAKALIVNGKKLDGNFIPYDLIKNESDVTIEVIF